MHRYICIRPCNVYWCHTPILDCSIETVILTGRLQERCAMAWRLVRMLHALSIIVAPLDWSCMYTITVSVKVQQIAMAKMRGREFPVGILMVL